VLKKDVVYSTRKKNLFFGYDIKLLSYLKTTPNLQGICTHSEIHIDSKMIHKITSPILRKLYAIFITISKRFQLKVHSYEKVYFGQKNIQSLFKFMSLIQCILFAAFTCFRR
jgi:hypothetical protein